MSQMESNSSENLDNITFREVYRGGWLRRITTVAEKKNGAYSKRGESVWISFCVHDDREPFLETYAEQKLAHAHRPDWCAPLLTCQHVTPNITATQEDLHEFVVTLSSGVVKLAAPTWDTMMEWVSTLRSKLVEMKILTPPENFYSQMPQLSRPLLPTRDPNSPLPPTPAGPLSIVPGTEGPESTVQESTPTVATMELVPISPPTTPQITPIANRPPVPIPIQPSTVQLPPSPVHFPETSGVQPIPRVQRSLSLQNSRVQNSANSEQNSAARVQNTVQNSGVQISGVQNINPISSIQVTSICSPIPRIPPISRVQNVLVQQTPIVQLNSMIQPLSLNPALPTSAIQLNSVVQPETSVLFSSTSTSLYINPSEPAVRPPLNRTTSEPAHNVTVIEVDGPIDAVYDLSISEDTPHYEHLYLSENENSVGARPEPGFDDTLATQTEQNLDESSQIESTPISISTQTEGVPSVPSRPIARRGRMVPVPTAVDHRRLVPPFRPPVVTPGMLTLREQQVLQLTREIRHPGGVRLQIRRRDCSGSIALVDAFGAVWIAGWKQREHPTLYNALHIGDRVLTVAGLAVPNAAHAHRIIRTTSCNFIEFIVRRVPFGRVLAIRRDTEGQDLGLELEGGTAEVKNIKALSPVARAGLPPKSTSCDGLSLCNWVLTEVNSRPLNLFFKDNEVRDRLNAVGMDVSILVQPYDLIKQLKKQLKAVRGYKDYLLQ